jgi:hypothetical protein
MKKEIIILIVALVSVSIFYVSFQTFVKEEVIQPIPDSIILSLKQGETYSLGTFTEGTFEGTPYTSAGQIYTVNIKSLFKGTKKANFVMENETGEKLPEATLALHNGNFNFTVPHGNWSFYVINNNQQNINISIKVEVKFPDYNLLQE